MEQFNQLVNCCAKPLFSAPETWIIYSRGLSHLDAANKMHPEQTECAIQRSLILTRIDQFMQRETNVVKLPFQCTCLVGVMTRAKIPYGSSESRCRMGRANAAVFPLPVFAQPMQSLPTGRVEPRVCREYSYVCTI